METKVALTIRSNEEDKLIIQQNKEINNFDAIIKEMMVSQQNATLVLMSQMELEFSQVPAGNYFLQARSMGKEFESEPQNVTDKSKTVRFNTVCSIFVDNRYPIDLRVINFDKPSAEPIFKRQVSIKELSDLCSDSFKRGFNRLSLKQSENQPLPAFSTLVDFRQSDVADLQDQKEEKIREIKAHIAKKQQIERYIIQITQPFGALNFKVEQTVSQIH